MAAANNLTVWNVRAAAELGLLDQLAGKPIDRLDEAARLARAAGALGTVASIDLQRGFWYYDRHRFDEALAAMHQCADATPVSGSTSSRGRRGGRALVHAARGDRPATDQRSRRPIAFPADRPLCSSSPPSSGPRRPCGRMT